MTLIKLICVTLVFCVIIGMLAAAWIATIRGVRRSERVQEPIRGKVPFDESGQSAGFAASADEEI